jgi:asparagine synthase (glutamine-hydrolysing)
MCGISGFMKFNQRLNMEDGRIIANMNKKLLHRGPDAQDTFLTDNVAFGFSRLSIIGLENGMQPICNEDESIVVICNGEIFNYIELREQLRKKGHHFKTCSDVEVIVHLYEACGMDLLNELNGQFAFALYDKNKKTMFCARDQMGIVPFFYTVAKNTFIFGSEIKAILEHPLVEREVDLVGLDQVFTFAGLISPRTMFKNIHSLENGHFLQVEDNGRIVNKEYWDLVYPEGEEAFTGRSEESIVEELEELFTQSVKLRLRSDVPTGFYLSGGLDSSAIAMKIKQIAPAGHREAFSIDFVDSTLSETAYQVLVARESNSLLNKKTFFSTDISERLQKSIYHCECPLKETYNTASLSLSESVRAKGVKVILSGEGADELFAGYVGYRFDKLREMDLLDNTATPAEENIRRQVWGDASFLYERDFSQFNLVKRSLYSAEVNAIFDEVNCLNHPVINKSRIENRNVLNKRLYVDYKLRLVDHLVSDHGDRMALANAVEVRYPFLDKNLIEFSTRIPAELKLKDLTEKYILKKMSERFVPKAVVGREKFGFVAPGSPYLIQNNIGYINDILSSDLIRRQGFFDAAEVDKLKNTYKRQGFSLNAPYESDLLITVITFGILVEEFFN